MTGCNQLHFPDIFMHSSVKLQFIFSTYNHIILTYNPIVYNKKHEKLLEIFSLSLYN